MKEIRIKNASVFLELIEKPMHPKLKTVLTWLMSKRDVYITCGHEKREYASVHSTDPLRGIDIRSWIYEDPQKVADEINEAWVYDPDRPEKTVALYHNSGRGKHIHLQACNSTIKA